MAPLDKSLFAGGGRPSENDINKVLVNNFNTDTDNALKKFGWDGSSGAAAIGLVLSVDNDTVEKSVLVLRGELEQKTMWIEAAKIWPGASSDVSLAVRFPTAEIFGFADGGMASELVPQELVTHGIYRVREGKQPELLLDQDYEQAKVRGFSLRAMAALSKRSGARNGVVVKVTVLIFPEEKAAMLQRYEAAQQATWPGTRLLEAYLPLLPRPTTPWGCPVLPLILPGAPMEDGSELPDGAELHQAIGATLRTAIAPNTARTAAALVTKWERLRSNPGEMAAKEPETTWPAGAWQESNVAGKSRFTVSCNS